jgi:centrosomal protein CEP120
MEEKLETALESKSFFKEKWVRALREINRIKDEHERATEIQIKHKEEELRNLG